MTNRFTAVEWSKVKNHSLCVISFREGIRTLTYANLSYKQAMEQVIRKQMEGEVCLIIPSSNTLGIKGLETREYKEEEETLEYYLKCLEGNKENTNKYLKEVGN